MTFELIFLPYIYFYYNMVIYTYSDLFESSVKSHPNKLAVIYYDNKSYKTYTYIELHKISLELLEFLKKDIDSGQCIGLLMNHNPIIPSLINLIHKCNCGFIFMNPNWEKKINNVILEYLNINFIISNSNFDIDDYVCVDLSLYFNFKLCFYKRKNRYLNNKNFEGIAYCIRTSGSTGPPKLITVPHKCIYPNVKDLNLIFNMRSDDIIYFSTPLTFDPSIIEIYLGASCGCALLIAPLSLKDLFLCEKKYNVTWWQTTPSKLILLGNKNIKDIILSDKSTLKTLVLGGEPLNYNLNGLKHIKNNCEIYTLYGVTEVSCWASYNKINIENYDEYLCIGKSLSETSIKIFNDDKNHIIKEFGFIYIGSSSRVCLVDKKNIFHHNEGLFWYNTGDLGIEVDGKIYFKGRNNKEIKRFGHKINIFNIEIVAMKSSIINQCICYWDEMKNILTLFYTSDFDVRKDFLTYLNKNLDKYSIPDNVIHIESIPVNDHGKTSITKIKELYLSYKHEVIDVKNWFLSLVMDYLPLLDLSEVTLLSKSFIDIGGTSIIAMQIINKLQNTFCNLHSDIYNYFLSSEYSIINIIDFLLNLKLSTIDKPVFNDQNTEINKLKSSNQIENLMIKSQRFSKLYLKKRHINFNIKVLWKYNTSKCIDANPVLFKNQSNLYLLVGSHSGKICILDAISGVPSFESNVSSRIEAPVFCTTNNGLSLAVVGCYDGYLWCFSISHSKVYWKTLLKGMIKSQVCQIGSNIYVATYKSILYKLDLLTGEILTSIKVGDKGISADLVNYKNYIYVGTLDGICCKITSNDDIKIDWEYKLSSPVFAKASFVQNSSCVLFSEVKGRIHCLNIDTGNTIWIFDDIQGLLFSSCIINTENNTDMALFGCHDHHTYKISCVENVNPFINWKVKNTSEIYATPCIIENSFIGTISTNGHLQIIDMLSGEIVSEFSFPGDVFSSPYIDNNLLFVGCRDDNVYCLKLYE